MYGWNCASESTKLQFYKVWEEWGRQSLSVGLPGGCSKQKGGPKHFLHQMRKMLETSQDSLSTAQAL